MTRTHHSPRPWPAVVAVTLALTSACSSGAAEAGSTASDPGTTTASSSTATTPAPATVDSAFEFADGTTMRLLGPPWSPAGQIDGGLVQLLPSAGGSGADDQVWADIIAYLPSVAFGPGSTEPAEMPDDPVAWTLAHPDLEILDQRQVTVDGVAATQIDARAVTPTGWLAVAERTDEWAGTERVVLVPSGRSWLVLRASTFDPERAFAAEAAPGDAFTTVLESIDLAD